jgi:AcrR family transcriptional regulator
VARQRLSVDHRRELLLRTGLQVLGAHEGNPPVDEIARAAGVSKGLLYHYFPDKEDFLVEVVREAAKEITAATATTPTSSVPEQIAQAVDGFLDYAQAHSAGLRVIFGHKYRSPQVLQVVREQRAARVDRVVEQVAGARPGCADVIRASAALRTSLDGALSFMETATLRWLEDGVLTRPAMRTLLMGALGSALALAAQIDPELRLDLTEPGAQEPDEPEPDEPERTPAQDNKP